MTRSRLLGNPRSLLGRIPQRGWSEAVHGHWEVRLVEEAVAQARAALGLDSTLVAAHFVQGDALRELGRYAEGSNSWRLPCGLARASEP
ncbi:MAG: hypothetical protein HY560_04110 [Gemmatimonadetes bacterium]|nr:hypothetical protein [Gemmatimonadota bacterium]